jgi:putative flippase GtrA
MVKDGRAEVRRLSLGAIQWLRLLRYGIVGGAISALYVVLTALIIETTSLRPVLASVAAFVASLPVAYWGHRHVTFGAAGYSTQFLRFAVTMTNAFVISSLSMLIVVDMLGASYIFALLATTVLVATINYTILGRWVFGGRRAIPTQQGHSGGVS